MSKSEYERYLSANSPQAAKMMAHEAHSRVLRVFNSLVGDENLSESVREELARTREKFYNKAQARRRVKF